jgi:hypothetical protein
MRVTGVDSRGQPFRERTSTLVLNRHGCKYPSKQKVKLNSWVTLEIVYLEVNKPPQSVPARVAWIQPPGGKQEYFHIGVELEAPGNVWDISQPPADWLPSRELRALDSAIPAAELPAADRTSPAPASVPDEEPGKLSNSREAGVATSLARPVRQLMSEVREQVQKTVSEAEAAAAAAETSHLLEELRTQLREEVKRTFEAMVASHTDEWVCRAVKQMNEAYQASAKTLHEQWSQKIELDLQKANECLAARSAELHQRTESLAASALERFHRVVEASRRESVGHFVSELEQQLAPLVNRAQEVLTKLGACEEEADQTSRTHRDWFEKTLQQSVLESAARMQETSGRLEEQFQQVISDRLIKALEELEQRSIAATQATLESVRRASESYKKQAQRDLQTALEPTLEQATNRLREKAAEISRLFAAELNDYSRSYREYLSRLVAELAKEIVNRTPT